MWHIDTQCFPRTLTISSSEPVREIKHSLVSMSCSGDQSRRRRCRSTEREGVHCQGGTCLTSSVAASCERCIGARLFLQKASCVSGGKGNSTLAQNIPRNLPMHHCLTSLLTWQSSCLTDRLTISVTAMTYAHDFPQPWGCFVAPLSESLVSLVGSFIGPFSAA